MPGLIDNSSLFDFISGKAKEISESESFKKGLGLAINGVNTVEQFTFPASYYGRELLGHALESNTGKELVKTLDAIPPNGTLAGGGWEDDAARAAGSYLKMMKGLAQSGEAGVLMSAVPTLKKFQRQLQIASNPRALEYMASVPKAATSNLVEKGAEPSKFIRYHNYGPMMNPAERRGGSYVQSYPGREGAKPWSKQDNAYNYKTSGANTAEGGAYPVSGTAEPKNTLGLGSHTYHGSDAEKSIGASGRVTWYSARGDEHYTDLPSGKDNFTTESFRYDTKSVNKKLPAKMRLNNTDFRKIGTSNDGPEIGFSDDAVGDYLLNKYAQANGYDSYAAKTIGDKGRELVLTTPRKRDMRPPNYTLDWDTIQRYIDTPTEYKVNPGRDAMNQHSSNAYWDKIKGILDQLPFSGEKIGTTDELYSKIGYHNDLTLNKHVSEVYNQKTGKTNLYGTIEMSPYSTTGEHASSGIISTVPGYSSKVFKQDPSTLKYSMANPYEAIVALVNKQSKDNDKQLARIATSIIDNTPTTIAPSSVKKMTPSITPPVDKLTPPPFGVKPNELPDYEWVPYPDDSFMVNKPAANKTVYDGLISKIKESYNK